ncbi:unnamed protein product [Sphagnum troendelagicum]
MAGLIKNLRVTKTGSSSRTLEEAHRRSMDFFREACRALPDIMDRYNLQEVTTLSELRSKIAAEFRKHSKVTNLKVVDMLVFKGQEELQYCVDHSKQRHHLLGQYIIGKEGLAGDVHKLGETDHGESEFLKSFYRGNS